MPELRKDPVTGNWVIIAIERSKRPYSFLLPKQEKQEGPCPFCYGNENETPNEIMAYRPQQNPDGAGWEVRVIPNKYAALDMTRHRECEKDGMYECLPGYGAHEVVIESPVHESSLGSHSLEHVIKIILTLKARYLELRKNPLFKYIQIFKNQGRFAGASLEHPHLQIVATPLIPPDIEAQYRGAEIYYRDTGRCIYCDIIKEELKVASRVIEKTDGYIAFCPYASGFPYQTCIMPVAHQADFGQLTDDEVHGLAYILKKTVQRLEAHLGHPPFNLMLRTIPNSAGFDPYFHWHIEVLPRLTGIAGFELSTGIYINLAAPEAACDALKNIF